MKSGVRRSRLLLIVLGLMLGYAARWVLGPPAVETENSNRFLQPLPETASDPSLTEPLEIEIRPSDEFDGDENSGLVPPIHVPVRTSNTTNSDTIDRTWRVDAKHDPADNVTRAVFEPHGELICASGCAVSRHPTQRLTSDRFARLIQQYAKEPVSAASPALESLLFYGPQTRGLLGRLGGQPLRTDQLDFLQKELHRTHARISLRVIDSAGNLRTWLPDTLVPLDRRHVFEMETKNLQPLVTSGTVKRVGLDHLWVRL